MSFIVPPGGFAGFAQMTPASRAALNGGRAPSSGRRRRKRTSTKSRTARGSTRKRGGGRKLKFGSPAWRKKYSGKAKRNAAKARRGKK